MKEKIGQTAGAAWELLQKNKEIAISQFPKMLNQKAVITNQALGWLAREGKINYRREGNRTLISLVDTERRS